MPYSSFSNPQSLNLYGYVGNDPITGEDPDGHANFSFGNGYNDGDNQNPTVNTSTSSTPASAVAAAANAFGSDMLGGVGRVDQDSPDGKIGAAIGDFGAALLGAGEVAFGTAGEALGTALDATGIGALAGVPINVVSAGVMAEGGATAAEGITHLAKDASSAGESGGRSANDVKPDPNASGSHSVLKKDSNGTTVGYTTFNEKGGAVKRVDVKGGAHGGVETPHVHEAKPGKGLGAPLRSVRPARPDELPQ